MDQKFDDILNRFRYHPATETTGPRHDDVRSECQALAEFFYDHLPESREKSLALTKLQEAMMYANSAIAIHG